MVRFRLLYQSPFQNQNTHYLTVCATGLYSYCFWPSFSLLARVSSTAFFTPSNMVAVSIFCAGNPLQSALNGKDHSCHPIPIDLCTCYNTFQILACNSILTELSVQIVESNNLVFLSWLLHSLTNLLFGDGVNLNWLFVFLPLYKSQITWAFDHATTRIILVKYLFFLESMTLV